MRNGGRLKIAGLFALATVAGLAMAGAASADLLGQPTPGGTGLQPAATQIRRDVIAFHDHLLLPIIVTISLLVLALLAWCVVRYNRRANPTPARWSHNTPVEIIWTIGPVLTLAVIAIFSFRLLYEENAMPRPYMTVKVTGRQWNWDYEYPDQKIAAATSTVMTPAVAEANHEPYLLGANAPMVVPVGKVVRVQVTAEDVIHSFSVPAFGVKIDAIPGKLNQQWFKADQVGTYYGQCSQLCGVDHSFMPIEVKVVSQPQFDAWVASKQPKLTQVAAAAPVGATPTSATASVSATSTPASGAPLPSKEGGAQPRQRLGG